ncbi:MULTISPECIES: UPF0158 family protein [unclassified Paenibacillus]|uniref:UPF0158 family protein n=1 Tax=unclassified Paenibacillus TaxID=185978 RepID=UPI003632388F
MKVKLRDIIDGMDMMFDGSNSYLNIKTGEVITVSVEELRAAEEEESFEHLHDWQQDNMEVAIDVIENFENYKELPTKFDINDYAMMESYIYSLENEQSARSLLEAIQGKGAFRRFKDTLAYLGILDNWYAYRHECYKKIAIEWCEDNSLEYSE